MAQGLNGAGPLRHPPQRKETIQSLAGWMGGIWADGSSAEQWICKQGPPGAGAQVAGAQGGLQEATGGPGPGGDQADRQTPLRHHRGLNIGLRPR